MTVYKIVPATLWRDAEEARVFTGSPADVRDGFIHFSTKAQLAETAAKHFAGQRDLLLVAVDAARLDIQWELSRGGELFPHVYGSLPLSVVQSVEPFEVPAADARLAEVPVAEVPPADVPAASVASVAPARVFVLSPANCSGKRAQQLLRPDARGAFATRLRSDAGVPLGELFAYASGLYFRGKLAYATRFASPPHIGHSVIGSGVHIITPNSGLRDPATAVRLDDVHAFARTAIDVENRAYRHPLEESAHRLSSALDDGPGRHGPCQVVLLGSIASPKYVDVLLEIFGERLCFPSAFVGRGDMSRGGLLLRQVASGEELDYVPIAGAVRRGARPPKLTPLPAPNGVEPVGAPGVTAPGTATRRSSRSRG